MLDSAPRLGSYEVLALIGVGGMLFVAQPLLLALNGAEGAVRWFQC